ncbi:hypothetical protein V8C86DRAFT_3146299 [Haematococcus lacustris]
MATALSRSCLKQITAASPRNPSLVQCMLPQTQPLLRLYDDDHSLYCAKLKIALLAKGVKFTSLPVPCGSTSSQEFLRVVPLGKIPALLVQEEGMAQPLVLMESEVIAEWLEDRFPARRGVPVAALLPMDPLERAQARTVARFHDLYFEPALRRLYGQVAPSQRQRDVVATAVRELHERTMQLETLLSPKGPFANGSTLTLADCAYPAAFLYADLILPEVLRLSAERGQASGFADAAQPAWPGWPPRIQQWQAALAANPHVQAVMTTLRPAAQQWVNSKLQLV